jgi:TolA-binding protein
LARLALAELLRKGGEADKAAEAFRKLASDPGWPLPKDHALMELARTLEEMNKGGEARATYQRIVDEFPSSVYAAEARRRAESLSTAG